MMVDHPQLLYTWLETTRVWEIKRGKISGFTTLNVKEFERLIHWLTGWYQRALTADITEKESYHLSLFTADRRMPPDSPQHSLWTALSTSIQPAVLGLSPQHSDHLPPGEGQQIGFRAARLVGHPSPRDSSFQRLWWRASNAPQGWRYWREDKWNRVQREQSVTAQVSW